MVSLRREAVIDATAEDVFRVVGRPELIHLWFPGVVSCTFDGAVRIITTGTGIPMPEEIITNDLIAHRLQYRITAGLFKQHLATFDAIDLDDGRCLAIYSTDAEPAAMALVVCGGTQGGLDELQRQFAAGDGPALRAVGLGTTVTAATVTATRGAS